MQELQGADRSFDELKDLKREKILHSQEERKSSKKGSTKETRRVPSDHRSEEDVDSKSSLSFDATDKPVDKNLRLSSCSLRIQNKQMEMQYQSYLCKCYVYRAKVALIFLALILASSAVQALITDDKEQK